MKFAHSTRSVLVPTPTVVPIVQMEESLKEGTDKHHMMIVVGLPLFCLIFEASLFFFFFGLWFWGHHQWKFVFLQCVPVDGS